MNAEDFFDAPDPQSLAKIRIVSKYFYAWAKIMARRSEQIAYVDLFAGPGQYDDGTDSTPLVILKKAIADESISSKLFALFNDWNSDHKKTLEQNIANLKGIGGIVYEVHDLEVGREIIPMLMNLRTMPVLLFADPWGYKGLSLRLLKPVLGAWGSECIFFFNYNRILPGLKNPNVKEHMDNIFGEETVEQLREELEWIDSVDEKEKLILEKLKQALRGIGGEYTCHFRFTNERGTRTRHHLIFVTKNERGYSIMKEIMAKESSSSEQGVASYEYNPAKARCLPLFDTEHPLDKLKAELLEKFAGKELTVKEIVESHHVGTRYTARNYKDALLELQQEEKIEVDPAAEKRPKGTMGDKVKIKFPKRRRP